MIETYCDDTPAKKSARETEVRAVREIITKARELERLCSVSPIGDALKTMTEGVQGVHHLRSPTQVIIDRGSRTPSPPREADPTLDSSDEEDDEEDERMVALDRAINNFEIRLARDRLDQPGVRMEIFRNGERIGHQDIDENGNDVVVLD